MSDLEGDRLLHAVAVRIVVRYLQKNGLVDVRANAAASPSSAPDTADVTYMTPTGRRGIQVRPDPYVGGDPQKVSDRSRSFYRADAGVFAFETVATNRQPGWLFSSVADELYYYCLAIDQTSAEVEVLNRESDETFFKTLHVDRDELFVIPFTPLRAWVEPRQESFATRPVVRDGGAAWYRLVPRGDVLANVPGARSVGGVFASL